MDDANHTPIAGGNKAILAGSGRAATTRPAGIMDGWLGTVVRTGPLGLVRDERDGGGSDRPCSSRSR
jgi:hypothetical protein